MQSNRTLLDNQQNIRQELEKLPKFIKTLYQLLQNQQLREFIRWSPDGKIVLIPSSEKLSQEVLPHYFKHNNYSSFVRQLNLYNFHKKKIVGEGVAFGHPMFMREREDLLKFITRKIKTESDVTYSPVVSNVSEAKQEEFARALRENEKLRMEHAEINGRLSALEGLVVDFTRANEKIKDLYLKKKKDEGLLKNFISELARIYGADEIGVLVEQVAFKGERNPFKKACSQRRFCSCNSAYERETKMISQSRRVSQNSRKSDHLEFSTCERRLNSRQDSDLDENAFIGVNLEKDYPNKMSNAGMTPDFREGGLGTVTGFEESVFYEGDVPSHLTDNCEFQQALTNDFSVFD